MYRLTFCHGKLEQLPTWTGAKSCSHNQPEESPIKSKYQGLPHFTQPSALMVKAMSGSSAKNAASVWKSSKTALAAAHQEVPTIYCFKFLSYSMRRVFVLGAEVERTQCSSPTYNVSHSCECPEPK
jgi:hypothetical protein